MRILLRNRKTGQYFQLPDHWTDDPELAFEFQHGKEAAKLAREKGFEKVEILLAFDNPRLNIRLPVRRNP